MKNELTVTTDAPNEIRMVRTFDAPRRLVVKAMTSPELMKRWTGGKRATVVSVENDLRPGGNYRIAYRSHDGFAFAFVGTYREVGDERTVNVEAMEGTPGEALVTTTLVEHDGRTTMTMVMAFPSQEIRDMVLQTGMATGAGESYDVLGELLATL
jgi:uncharacterized protein YndB with AHSA1/START domain